MQKAFLGHGSEKMIFQLIIVMSIVCWALFWKGIGLWTAGTRKDKKWFILMFFFSTLGLLEMYYVLSRKKKSFK